MSSELKEIIEAAYEKRAELSSTNCPTHIKEAIFHTIHLLDKGELRVAEKQATAWITHQWIKQAILLYFKLQPNQLFEAGYTNFFDKVPLKFNETHKHELANSGIRVVPPAHIRQGAYVAPNTILMPSYINIGAYVDSGTMIDTWATVGSCAQIGKNVHISGGVGIGGVLEPLQANPTIIEDDCFIGARAEVAEGVIVEKGSVIGMGVFLSQSTRIYNRLTGETTYGRIPAGSVVVSGNIPNKENRYSLYAAIIVKQVDEKTRSKTSLNELLRNE